MTDWVEARRGRCRGAARALCLGLALLAAAPGGRARAEAPVATENDLRGGSPRSAVRGFLLAARAGDWERAATYLDLRALPAARRRRAGPETARRLKAVLDRTLWVDVDALSREPDGHRDDGLPASQDYVGTIQTAKGPVDVLVERPPGRTEAPQWRIAAVTVARVPALYEELGGGRLVDRLPAPLVRLRFLEVQLWQWIALLALLAAAALAARVGTAVTVASLRAVARRSGPGFRDELLELTVGPLRLVIGVLVFSTGSLALWLAVPAQRVIAGLTMGLAVLAVAWLLLRLTDVLARTVEQRLIERGRSTATSVVPLGRRTVKIFLGAIAAVAMLQNFGFDVTGILAGLGIGGLAVALAAQKTVENFFGGITLVADQPVRVGDFCRFGERVGLVEDIGIRSTRVRTLDRTIVSIPNAEFSSMQIENFAVRDRFWLRTQIGLRYETTPDQLRFLLVELRRLLLAHPQVSPDPARVRFVGFGAYSLDVEIFAYVLTADMGEFLAVREELFLQIMDVVEASGSGFAFPSQTIYAGQDRGLDAERGRAAEAQVRRWREEEAAALPDVAPGPASPVAGTLPGPPPDPTGRR